MLGSMHPHLTAVFSRLDRSREALGAAVESIAVPLRQQRPGPEQWSAAEVLEHVSIVERIFSDRVSADHCRGRTEDWNFDSGGKTSVDSPASWSTWSPSRRCLMDETTATATQSPTSDASARISACVELRLENIAAA